MDNKENNAPVSLSTMTQRGFFTAQGKRYEIIPLKLKLVDEFKADNLFNGFFSMRDEESKAILNKWLQRQLSYNDSPVTLELIFEHDWDVLDVTEFIKTVMGLSG